VKGSLPRRLRVLHVVASLDVGGLERVVWDLARLADRSRFDVTVLCLDRGGATFERFQDAGIAIESLDAEGQWAGLTVPRLAGRIRALQADVIHTHNMKAHLLGTLAAGLAGSPPVVNTKHGRVFAEGRPASLINRFAVARCRRIVAVSADTARGAVEIERTPAAKVMVIHNGVDIEAYKPPDGRPAGAAARAIHVARLSREKDQATLLRAARLVADQVPGFGLDLVGDGPMRRSLELLVAELDLGPQVVFHGSRDDVADLLRGAGVFVLSSLSEGISLTLLEAMATALPVVATDVGGNAEVVVQGETGLLVPPADPARLAEALLSVIRDPDRGFRMGQAGRRRAEESFDLQAVVRAYERLYLEMRNEA